MDIISTTKLLTSLGVAFVTAAVLFVLLVNLWRAKVAQDKAHREELKEQFSRCKSELHDLLEENMSITKEATATSAVIAEILRNVERTLDRLDRKSDG